MNGESGMNKKFAVILALAFGAQFIFSCGVSHRSSTNTVSEYHVPFHDTVTVKSASGDTLYRYRTDTTVTTVSNGESIVPGISLRTNLIYLASSTPNIGIDIPLSEHISVGGNAGLKVWSRWLPGDNDSENPKKWRHILIAPEFRWWPKRVYEGWFTGADLIYTHYNVGGVTFPFGMYKTVKDHRLQGNFFGVGVFAGYSWYLNDRLRLEAEAGIGAGYNNADKYECVHCGARIGKEQGLGIVPKLGLNLAWNLSGRRKQQISTDVKYVPLETIVKEKAPLEYLPITPIVPDWKGIAGQLEKDHPVLRPSSEYRPYTPDRILRKEKGALHVYFERDRHILKRDFREGEYIRDNGPTLDEIIDITSRIMADTTSHVTKIQIIGLASIEGRLKHNITLADNRAMALQKYIQNRLNVSDDLFDTVGGGEAWSELRDQLNDMLADGGNEILTAKRLRSVLDIIDSEPSLDRREAKLRALEGGAVYNALIKYVFQDQRNSGWLRIYYDYVPDENARIINDAISKISAGRYSNAIALLEQVRDDERSDNAYAIALFYSGDEDGAIAVLRKAAARGDKDAAKNLAGIEAAKASRQAYEKRHREWEEMVSKLK